MKCVIMIRKLIKRYPVTKTMLAYLCINTAADMNEQIFLKGHRAHDYDVWKTVRIGVTGCFVISPMIYNWIRFIDRAVPGKGTMSVVKKVAADNFLFDPVVLSTFFITTNMLERKKDLTEEWKQKFLDTWTTGLMFWLCVQTINFSMIPPHLKTSIYMPTASFIWTSYLCFVKDKPVTHHQQVPDSEDDQQVSLDNQTDTRTVSESHIPVSEATCSTVRVESLASTDGVVSAKCINRIVSLDSRLVGLPIKCSGSDSDCF